MDLKKATDAEKLSTCRLYFFVGLLLLPFVWAVNVVWFFEEAFRKPQFEEQKPIKKYVIWSLLGSLFWCFVLATWMIIFQTKRAEWGAIGDYMSFIIPLGHA